MEMTGKSAASPKPSQPPSQPEKKKSSCEVVEAAGGLTVMFEITDPATVRRIYQRVGTMDVGMYLWENIIKRAIDAHVW